MDIICLGNLDMDIILFYILLYFLSYRLWIILSGKSISLPIKIDITILISTNIEIKITSIFMILKIIFNDLIFIFKDNFCNSTIINKFLHTKINPILFLIRKIFTCPIDTHTSFINPLSI